MTPTERIEQIEAELKELKEQVRHEADPVVESQECLVMCQGFVYPVPSQEPFQSGVAADFNQSQNKPVCPCAKAVSGHRIVKVSRHKSGKFSVEDTGEVFDPWSEQQDDFKPIGELVPDLSVGDEIEVKLKVNIRRLDPGTLHPVEFKDLGWVKRSIPARKVSP